MGLGDANTTPHGSVGVTTEPCEAIHDKTCIRTFALACAATAGRPIARFRARRAQRATLTSRALADSSIHALEPRVRAPLMRAMAPAEATQAAPQKAHVPLMSSKLALQRAQAHVAPPPPRLFVPI